MWILQHLNFPVEGYDNGWVKDGYNSFFIKNRSK